MRRILYLLLIVNLACSAPVFAQQKFDYNVQWKEVDRRNAQRLTRSALALTDSIYARAVKDGNTAQKIKALLYETDLRQLIDDSSEIHNLQRVKDRMVVAKGPERALLQSIYAELLARYLSNHYYDRSRQTALLNDSTGDITTWSVVRLNKEINTYYQASIAPVELLYKTKLDGYKPLIIAGSAPAIIRPTLYDFLAHRALSYFKGETYTFNSLTTFRTYDPLAFARAEVFAAHTFMEGGDTATSQYRAIGLFQQLLRLHLADGNRNALLAVDKERVQFMYSISETTAKDSLHSAALETMIHDYEKLPEVTGVYYLLACKYWAAGNGNKPDTLARRKAKTLCDEAIALAPNSYGANDCKNLRYLITSKLLGLQGEIVNLPGLPFRMLVNYRNIDKIYLHLVQLHGTDRNSADNWSAEDVYWNNILRLPLVRSWEQSLPGTQYYEAHNAEIKVDALPLGQYALVASLSPAFKMGDNLLAVQEFAVSNISYLQEDHHYIALHRQSGKPLAGITARLWGYANNADRNAGKRSVLQAGFTDNMGSITLPEYGEQTAESIEWNDGKDTLLLNETNGYSYRYYNREADKEDADSITVQTVFFTDRAIYRPGQTVSFKGIVIAKDQRTGRSSASTKVNTTIFLYDESDDAVDSIAVKTNEYGAYWGKLQLPSEVRPGEFHLEDDSTHGRTSFSVEEYKRPTFEIVFDTLHSAYQLRDSVTLGATAMAYAGNNVDGAMVKYRVLRTVQYLYPWQYSHKFYPQGHQLEIANGEVTTDAAGHFNVRFAAEPDEQTDSINRPLFNYTVYADVTDVNGETHAAEQTVKIGYQSLLINISLPARAKGNDLQKVMISTESPNGDFIPTPVTATLTALQAPATLLRKRYWPMPDQFVMTKAEYKKEFPLDIYKDEDDKTTWPHGAVVWEKKFTIAADSTYAVAGNTLASGTYELELTAKDTRNKLVQQKLVFDYFDTTGNTIPGGIHMVEFSPERAYAPGDNVIYNMGIAHDSVYLLKTSARREDTVQTAVQLLHKGWQQVSMPVHENDYGGYLIDFAFVKDNRFYEERSVPRIPFPNKILKVELQSYRNKMLPGEKQQWKLHISGHQTDKAAAELLAGMYDASLDAFNANHWEIPSLYPYFSSGFSWVTGNNMKDKSGLRKDLLPNKAVYKQWTYDQLNWMKSEEATIVIRGYAKNVSRKALTASMSVVAPSPMAMAHLDETEAKAKEVQDKGPAAKEANTPVRIRKDFRETAFFLPDLHTDKDGSVSFSFTMPDAQTRWKFMALAHTKDLAFGYLERNVVTQQQLMVQANAPRFLRTRDHIELSAKVSNLTDSVLQGNVKLELQDAATGAPVDVLFENAVTSQPFRVAARQSTVVRFALQVPPAFNSALQYKVVATSGAMGDGEENAIPVLTNTTLVIETLPLSINGDGSRTFELQNLLHSDTAKTLVQHNLQLEFTTNPIWYAVQSLPYLMDYPYECAEQTFNKYYANTLGGFIVAQLPQIKAVFEKWNTEDTAALLSNLQKNESLKSALLAETPWVLEARSEAAQHREVAQLFDLYKLGVSRTNAKEKLMQMQLSSGAFPWFRGMYEDRFITQYIVAGIGRLQHLGISGTDASELNEITKQAIVYLDQQVRKDYLQLLKDKADTAKAGISTLQAHYLYARSFFPKNEFADSSKKAWAFYQRLAAKSWQQQGSYTQSLIALALYRNGDVRTARSIIAAFKENTIESSELGTYWKDQQHGYYWQQAPVEAQAQMLETFDEIEHDTHITNGIRTWLLKNKQVHNWSTTKATADACYALLLHGSDALTNVPSIVVKVGKEKIVADKTEAGTGYFTHQWKAADITPGMGTVTVAAANTQGLPAWGALYWQYFQDMDAVKNAQTSLQLKKQLYIKRNTTKGPVLDLVTNDTQIKVGDKITVRLILKTDRDLEYVHLKDLRAACFEPVDVHSGYQWESGIGYYKAIKDVSMNFFFGSLGKGTHVLEYDMYTTHKGDFSNGISTLQCMYAPEFSAHSEGLRVKVSE